MLEAHCDCWPVEDTLRSGGTERRPDLYHKPRSEHRSLDRWGYASCSSEPICGIPIHLLLFHQAYIDSSASQDRKRTDYILLKTHSVV